MSIRGTAAIVGAAQVDTFRTEGRSPVGLMAVSVTRALADAGLTLADVDGVFTSSSYYAFPSLTLSEYLGIHPRFVDTTAIGGASFVAHLGHAAAAIQAGLCEVAVVAYGSTQRSDAGKLVSMAESSAYEAPYGLLHPIGAFGMVANRHMAQYGTTSEQLAELAVAARAWSLLTDDAPYPTPLTIDEVVSSPVIASPLHKLDCCLVTDGAGALVVTSAERARDLARPPVYVLGAGTAHTHGMSISQMGDVTTTGAAVSGPQAMAMAGIGHEDVDVVELYDSFTITALMTLEDLGFCDKGEGGDFVSDGRLGPGGSLPTNTNGGGLAYTHPGMYGMFILVEAVRQLRGECGDRQVPGAEVAVANGCGGVLSCTSTIVLGTEATR